MPVFEQQLAQVLAFQAAGCRAADGGGQQLLEGVLRFGQAQRLGNAAVDHAGQEVHLLLGALAVLVALRGVHIGQDVARQRPHLHRVAAPARGLEPGVLGAFVDFVDVGARALGLGAQHVVGLGDAVPGVQALGFVGVLVPGVGDEFLDLLGVAQIDRVDLAPVAIDDGAAGQLVRALVVADLGVLAVVHDVEARQTAAVEPARLLVQRADGQHVGQIDVAVERVALVDARLDEVEPLHVDGRPRRAIAVDVDGAGHAAHQVVGVRVLAAEDGVDLDPFLLQVQRLQVVRHGHQVGLGRQDVGLGAPVAVLERPELATLDKLLDAVLDVAEVARRGQRVRGRHQLLQLGGLLGVGLEAGDHIDPVQRVQVVEVHHMVLHHLGLGHDFSDQVGVPGDLDAQRILHRAHRGQRMAAGAHATDALDEGPGVARVAPLEDDLQPAPERAGGHRVADHVVAVEVDLAAHMPFDARDRIDDDALAAVVECEGGLVVGAHGAWLLVLDQWSALAGSFLSEARLRMDTAACAATAAPTAPAAATPTLSALDSTPKALMLVSRS